MDDVPVLETAIGLDFTHSCFDPFLPRGHQYLLQRITSAGGDIRDQINERESSFTQQLLDSIRAAIDLERRVTVVSSRPLY